MWACLKLIMAASFLLGWIPFIGKYFKSSEPETTSPPEDFPNVKVGIIGGGIGGCSSAYFLRELCGDNVEIHVFNDSQVVGGRCAVIEFEGNIYESGGAVIHTSNKHMVELRKKFGLKEFNSSKVPSSPLAIYNGQRFVLHLGFSSILNNLKLFWKYGLSLFRMSRSIHSELKDFSNIYKLQERGESFKTVPDMLRAMGGERFCNEITVSADDYYKNTLGWNADLVDDLVCAGMKCNYGQTNQIDAFTGFVSLAGMEDGYLWSVIGGNRQIPEKALEASKATYHVSTVTKVTKESDNMYMVEYSDSSGTSSIEFDVVIIAHPLNLSKIEFANFSQTIYTDGTKTPYHRTVATWVKGKPNAKLFGYPKADQYPRDYPLTILTNDMTDPPLDFNSCSQEIPATASEEEVKKNYNKPLRDLPTQVFKVFSNTPLSDSEISQLFVSTDGVASKDWLAYPQYSPPEECPPFVLDTEGGLLYINGIEKAASAMEMSAIGAKNVALLAKEYILKKKMTQ